MEKINRLICTALLACGLTGEQVEKCKPPITRGISFITEQSEGPFSEDSVFWDFKQKVQEAASLLGVDKDVYVKAAVNAPSLFYQVPETVNWNIENAARLLGLDKAVYVAAALKSPALFCLLPETVSSHAGLMGEFNRRGMIIPPVRELYLANPWTLALSDDNFRLRLTFAERAGKTGERNFGLLTTTRKVVEKKMIALLGFDPGQKEIHAQPDHKELPLLREMIADRRIKGYKLADDGLRSAVPLEICL